MKENLAILVALIGLVLPWFGNEDGPHLSKAVAEWDGTGMPPDERYEDWS